MSMNMQDSPRPTGPLATLPVELLQRIFLHLLLSCLHDTEQGTRFLHICIHALTAASKTTRANVMAVLRMVRKEIAVGGDLVEYCARPWEMRVLVLTLDYKFSSPYWARLQVERYREVRSMRRAQERAEREGKRSQLKMNGGTVTEEEANDDERF